VYLVSVVLSKRYIGCDSECYMWSGVIRGGVGSSKHDYLAMRYVVMTLASCSIAVKS